VSCFKRRDYYKEKPENVAPDLNFLMLSLSLKSLVFFLRFFWIREFPYYIWECSQSCVSCPLFSQRFLAKEVKKKYLEKYPRIPKLLLWLEGLITYVTIQCSQMNHYLYNFIHTCICKRGKDQVLHSKKSLTQVRDRKCLSVLERKESAPAEAV